MAARCRVGTDAVDRVRLARWLAIATVAMGLLVLFGGAVVKPDYSQVSQYISELNATGTARAVEIGVLGFAVLGLLLAAFLLVAAPVARVKGASRAGYWLLWSQPIAYLGAVIVPCDAGCPAEGSISQGLHNLLGVLTYPAAGIGFLLLATAPGISAGVRATLVAAGIIWLGMFGLMVDPAFAGVRGSLQRIAEAMLYVVIVLVAWKMSGPASKGHAGE